MKNPLTNPKITQPFGGNPKGMDNYYNKYGLKGHNGIDLATFWGDKVYAAHDGNVLDLKEDPFGFGKYVRLISDKTEGFYWLTYYGHLSKINVKDGQRVKEGDIVGLEGNTGACLTNKKGVYVPAQDLGDYLGTHLHFGVYKLSDPIPNTFQVNFFGKTYTILNHNNGYRGGIDPYPLIFGKTPETKKTMTKEKLFQIYHEILIREPNGKEAENWIDKPEETIRSALGKSNERQKIIKYINLLRGLKIL